MILKDIEKISDFYIEEMESENNHIHILIRCIPRISIASIVNRIKSISTFRIWKEHEKFLKTKFCKEKTFWTDSYFVSSIGYASQEPIKNYIKSQG